MLGQAAPAGQANSAPATQGGTGALADVANLKRRIDRTDAGFADRFWAGEDVDALVAQRARTLDALLAEIWRHWFERNDNLALLAVGGYGRGELHPHSDVDLLILARKPQAARDQIAAFVRLLWDLKLDIGHSVRTVADCRREAAHDITVATTLMERRRLAGSARLAAKLDQLLARRSFWPSDRFFRAKRNEQEQRHRQFDEVDHGLEPNIKSSPGGLRDIQTVQWITARHQHATGTPANQPDTAKAANGAKGNSPTSANPPTLVAEGFLTPLEARWLHDGRRFLWRVRCGLHLLTGRREDRLLFDHQRELARRFGYEDTPAQLAVEQFMHHYYRHVLLLREVNDILLQHFDEAIVRAGERPRIEPVNARFRVRNHYIEVTADDVFARRPAAMMEMFVHMAERPDIAGVRAATIRLVREHLHLINDRFRADPEVTAHFMALLRATHSLSSQLTRMRRYGVLGRYIPEFGAVIGQMQHDLFHIYTVDAHTMMVIRQMRRFRRVEEQERFPVAAEIMRRLPKVELLHIAGLFHDIGKGRGGDHSALGAADAVRFCQRHRLDSADTALVEWLVREHLTMSATAQRKDIADPNVIHDFANHVGTATRLDYLYALTVADINATNPTLWNSWRAALMHQLYHNTRHALRRRFDADTERRKRAAACRAAALRKLGDTGVPTAWARKLWQGVGEDFFLHHAPAQVAAITGAIHEHRLADGPLVTLIDVGKEGRAGHWAGATEIFLHARDRDNLFADSVAAIDRAALRVTAAQVYTSASGLSFNAYVVLDRQGRPLRADKARRRRLVAKLTADMASGAQPAQGSPARVSRQLQQFMVPTEVTLETPPGASASTLRVIAADRRGLLATLGGLFAELDIGVRRARITTLGERVEDVFEITNRAKQAITHAGHAQTITNAIRARLDMEVAGAKAHAQS